MRCWKNILAGGVMALIAVSMIDEAAATPLSIASKQDFSGRVANDVIQVRSRGRDAGAAAAAGIAGAIIGGIIASQGGSPYYPAYPYAPYPAYRPYPYDPAIAYCMRRFRSYDPYSGTYLGYDGFPRYCP